MAQGDIQQRIEAVNQSVDVVDIVRGAVRLGRGNRGKCPFHGSKSDSFAVYPDTGRARCWGCGWSDDAIGFVRDFYGLDFMGALVRLEGDLGLDGLSARPVRREKVPQSRWEPRTVDSALVAERLWSTAVHDPESLRVWLRARKVPEAMLGDHWFGQLRFCASGPISAWAEGKDHTSVAKAPAMVGLMRRVVSRPPAAEGGGGADVAFGSMPTASALPGERVMEACGVHATFLSPGLRAKMNRKRGDGSAVAARKMFGASSGAFVVLGQYRRDCPLYVGEGIETVLSGMALAGAGEDACGLAVLSLGNLQGEPRRWKHDVLPLFDVKPDPGSVCVAFAHDGPVTVLIDADMKPLRGWKNPQTGALVPPAVVERAGGPVVRREITSAERAQICATLATQRWRAAGCRRVTAGRPPMGMDFNDLARESA